MINKTPFISLKKEEKELIKKIEIDQESQGYLITFFNDKTQLFAKNGIIKKLKNEIMNLNLSFDWDSFNKEKNETAIQEIKKDADLQLQKQEDYKFISDNIETLKEMIENYKIKSTISIIENKIDIPKHIYDIKDNKIISFRLSEKIKDDVTNYAKENKIKLQDLVNYIFSNFLNNVKKN